MVSPYLKRRAGRERVTFLHPSLEPILGRTLGFPIFQEQLLRVAMVLAGFSGGDAEALRRAMTHKRSEERMALFAQRFQAGAMRQGLTAEAAAEAWSWFDGFAQYGFPESHAYAFAYWVYASAYLKAYHPAVFLVSLLNAQPMGFYSAATLVKDAQRHGVIVHRPDVGRSAWLSTLEGGEVRLGFKVVQGIGERVGLRCEAERRRAPFVSPADFAERCGMSLRAMEVLAEADAFAGFGLSRRQALWEVRAALGSGGPLWAGEPDRPERHRCRRWVPTKRRSRTTAATRSRWGRSSWRTTGDSSRAEGVVRAKDILALPNGRWTRIAGLVIARQHPTTVRGLIFVTLEDETGHANAVIMPEVFAVHRATLLGSPLLVIEGPLQHVDGVATVQARKLRRFGEALAVPRSHDFH